MPRRRRATRRSATEWVGRGLAAAVVAGIGWTSVAHTLGYSLRSTDPVRAHALAPHDGRVTAQLAQRLAGAEASLGDRMRADRLAREALRQDATAVTAVSILGINAQLRGDTPKARQLFGYSQQLSRRDLQTQLWAIEDAVGRNDVASTLRHYDIALRTSRNAAGLLFPILASAITEDPVRAALTRTLSDKPIWQADFISYVAGNSPDPRATASLFLTLRRAGVPVPNQAAAMLVGTLVTRNLLEPAWAYYSMTHPGADRRHTRDPRFTADHDNPSPFDWTPSNDAGISTSVQRGEQDGVFDFSAAASVGGPLLKQLQLLPSGEYRLDGHSIGIDQSPEANPYWTLVCADGRELGRVVVPNSMTANGVFVGRFNVPAGCESQTLTLVARPSDAVGGLSGQIDRVQLTPARQ